ncbi:MULTISPECIES: tetratricopeptide repeat protein [Acidiplasma]|jgi:tetratricopeptide (TPR) repeat protein|uniref:Uncharacterized protein n=1 Tax=Acidiplasma cupricumulans TaxID=312540 RepID=A0A0Q0VPX7_9ARCH|nr:MULTISPECIES: tetratricopeptide repeat protein [Acidiplasma]KJE49184.1 hypothetical protein TZ01_03640 [Acidiplasma sp. MBA-1]KQB35790.1 hypothetical protein AOG55_05715 [Acidiplasma cupricumulans]WMT54867.1 MAG: tetratricopeptide repeat protein [Acidiplasma sp.]
MENLDELIENGDKAMGKEKYMDAVRYYTQAYNGMTDASDEKAEICYKLSQAYFALEPKNTENPLKYAQESLDIHNKLNEDDMKIMDLMNIGYINLDSGKRDDAIKYFEEAIKIAEGLKEGQLIAMAYNAKAEALSSTKGGYKEALDIYNKVIEMTESSGDWENYFEAVYGKINILRSTDIDEAFSLAKESLDKIDKIMDEIKTKKDKKEFKSSLSYIYDAASDIAMELENIDEAMKIAARSKE